LEYPKKPINEHKTFKIFPDQYPIVYEMRHEKMTIESIAKHFNVGKQTIRFILDPSLREKHNKKTVERAQKRLETDDDFRQSQTDAVVKYMKDRKSKDPKYKKYHQEIVTNANRNRNKKKKAT